MHDKIFGEQNRKGQGSILSSDPAAEAKQWAREISLDPGRFNACLDSLSSA